MIVKFFANKKGGGVSSIDYLLDKRVQQGTARIINGDEKLTRSLIQSMSQKHKACVGCLSFEEKNIDEGIKQEIITSFENTFLTPAMKGRYNILWVEHTDKGRLELNFVIPKIDLESKKAFNPYFHKADYKRKDIWTDYTNLKYNFTDPKNPEKQNTIQGSKKEIGLIRDYETLDKVLHEQVRQGKINSREQIILFLELSNIEVTRQGKDYLSIKLPDSKKAKRFKGDIYNEQFKSDRSIESIHSRKNERERAYYKRDNQAILRELEQELIGYINSKSKFYEAGNSRQQTDYKRELQGGNTENTTRAIGIQVDSDNNQLLFRGGSISDNVSSIQVKAEHDNIRNRIDSRNRKTTNRNNALSRQIGKIVSDDKKTTEKARAIIESRRERTRASQDKIRENGGKLQADITEHRDKLQGIGRTTRERLQREIAELTRNNNGIQKIIQGIKDAVSRIGNGLKIAPEKIKEIITKQKEPIKRENKGFSR